MRRTFFEVFFFDSFYEIIVEVGKKYIPIIMDTQIT